MKKPIIYSGLLLFSGVLYAAEFHVAITGRDSNEGTVAAPLRTIQRGAELAQPGDTITVHSGVYRERINPPRGGESEAKHNSGLPRWMEPILPFGPSSRMWIPTGKR